MGPSTPTEAPPSSNEVANARAAAHPSMALHLHVRAGRARPRDTLCLGPGQIAEKLGRFSGEPASHLCLRCSGHVVSLSRRACLRAIPFTSCALGRGAPSRRMGLTTFVSTAKWAPTAGVRQQRLPAPCCPTLLQHPSPNHEGKRLSAPFHLLLDSGALQSPEDIPCAQGSQQLSMPSAGGPSCREDGHTRTNAQLKKGSWKRNLRSNKTRNGCGSIRQERSVGNTVNGIDARGPPCDLNNVPVRECGEQPRRATRLPATPFLVCWGPDRQPRQELGQRPTEPNLEPCIAKVHGLDAVRNTVLAQRIVAASHFLMSLTNHFDGIRSTGLVCCAPQSDTATAPQTS